jgi:hypothetical protein
MASLRRSEGQRRHLVSEFRRGALGQQAFCRLNGIGGPTFGAWLREFAAEAKPCAFLPVRVERAVAQEGARRGAAARIVSPCGVVLEFAYEAEPAWVAAVCREVS